MPGEKNCLSQCLSIEKYTVLSGNSAQTSGTSSAGRQWDHRLEPVEKGYECKTQDCEPFTFDQKQQRTFEAFGLGSLIQQWGSPGGSVVKNSRANAEDTGDGGLIPGFGRFPGGGNDNSLSYSCLKNPIDRGAWWATVHGVTKSQNEYTQHSCTRINLTVTMLNDPESCACVLSRLSPVQLFQTLWAVAHQAPLSTGFSRQEYWNGLPFLPPRDLPNPGVEPESLTSPALASRVFTTSTTDPESQIV